MLCLAAISPSFQAAFVALGRSVSRPLVPVALLLLLPCGARGDEPSGCTAFKWPLAHEAEQLKSAGKPELRSGDTAKPDGTAYTVELAPLSEAHLPQPPGRPPKSEASKAAFLRFQAPKAPTGVQVTVSAAVWVDVLQAGKVVKPSAFSGARDCPGVRKSLRFPLAAEPFVIEMSGADVVSIGILAAPTP